MFENDGTSYFVSVARGTQLFFNSLRKYRTPLANNCIPDFVEAHATNSEIASRFFPGDAASESTEPRAIFNFDHILGFRYSTSSLASSANCLARRPLAKSTDGRREAALRCFVDEGAVPLSKLP